MREKIKKKLSPLSVILILSSKLNRCLIEIICKEITRNRFGIEEKSTIKD